MRAVCSVSIEGLEGACLVSRQHLCGDVTSSHEAVWRLAVWLGDGPGTGLDSGGLFAPRPTPSTDSSAKGVYNEGTHRDSVATLQASFSMYFHAPTPHTHIPTHAPDSCLHCPSTDGSPTPHSSGDTHYSSSLSPSLTVDAGELISTSGVQDVSLFRRPRHFPSVL